MKFAQHTMKLPLLACALLACCAAAPASDDQLTTTDVPASHGKLTTTCGSSMSPEYNKTSPFLKTTTITSTPPAVFMGTLDRGILRCLQKDPARCEVFHDPVRGYFNLITHMEYLYAASFYNIVRCELTTNYSCKYIYNSNIGIMSMAIGDGKLFVGIGNGTVIVSELNQTSGFRTLHTFTGRNIYSLKRMDNNYIYVGLEGGHLMRCSTTKDNSCTLRYDMKTDISGLANINDTIIGVTWDSRLWNCSHKDETNDCVSVALNFNYPRAITVFNGDVYVVKQKGRLYKCKWGNEPICSEYAKSNTALNIGMAFVYGTYLLQHRFRIENRACTLQRDSNCPHYISYSDTQPRAALQVHVRDGKLYDSEGALVDTRDADEGHSGPAAIFAMSPDGTILLLNKHKGMFHISSLFAGSPVSGAGEMKVIDGVIKKMMACSDHYLPDLELNKQVIQSLSSQGYTEPIESVLCCDGEECDNTSTNQNRIY